MKITLKINGEEKTFIAPFVSARRLKETLALSGKVQGGYNEAIMDDVGEYMVNIYGNQFSLDDLLDGYPADEFFNKALEDMERVIGNFGEKLKN